MEVCRGVNRLFTRSLFISPVNLEGFTQTRSDSGSVLCTVLVTIPLIGVARLVNPRSAATTNGKCTIYHKFYDQKFPYLAMFLLESRSNH